MSAKQSGAGRYTGWLLAAMAIAAGSVSAQPPVDRPVSFARDVRKILADRCFRCHGPDRISRQADLRLDSSLDVFAEREGHFVVVAGQPESSELIRRITSTNGDEQMPPVDSGLSLTTAEIDVIRSWIRQGARWEQHWAWNPPRRPVYPSVSQSRRIRNEIDTFVQHITSTANFSHPRTRHFSWTWPPAIRSKCGSAAN